MRCCQLALLGGLGAALSLSSPAVAAPEPVEVRLLRTAHVGALQGLAEADLRRMSAPGEPSDDLIYTLTYALAVSGRGPVRFLDSLQRVAEIRDGRGPKPFRFEHLHGCWRRGAEPGEAESGSGTPQVEPW